MCFVCKLSCKIADKKDILLHIKQVHKNYIDNRALGDENLFWLFKAFEAQRV